MNNIFILDGQTDEVLGHINKKYVIDNEHERDLPTHKDYFRFTVLADNKHAEHLTKRNGLIIPGEDGELLEFRIFESIKYRNNEGLFIEVHALATYLDLKNQKIFDPHKTSAETALQHATIALDGTEWQVGEIDFKGIRTLTFDNPFNSYDYTLRIAREFELEPRFYIKTDGQKVTGRYVDLVERIGEFRGRTIEFGRDLQSIERKEDTSNIVTALWIYGPQREDGTRLKVFVEDDEARQRWGRRGQHIIDYYEPQTENQDITEERLKTLGEMELKKRINAVVTYEAEILDLENVPGLENKKIRFGDTIRIKDTKFNPPLYLEARVFNVKRDVFNKAKKTVQLGDYREYTEEEVKALFRQMQEEIRRRLERLVLVSIISSAGNVFKNAQGETQLTARTFVSGSERDEDGTLYDYQWMLFDKDGNHDTDFYAEGKTITVKASDIDEKATYRVLVAYELEVINTAEITISNVFDGEDGEPGPPGPPGEDGKTFYTWIKYADTPTSGISDSPEGKEYIGIAYNKETSTPSTNYDDYIWAKFKGEQGIPGPPGEDGQPTYTWVKYADDEHGNGMSDSPDGKLYIGLAFNKTTPEESNNPADYTWSIMPQNIEIGVRNYIRNLHSGEWFKINSIVNVDIISETRARVYGDSGSANHRYAIVVPLEPSTEYTIAANFIEADNSYFLFREKNNTEKDRSGQINIHTPDQRTAGNYTVGEGEVVYTFTTTENTRSIIIEIGSSGNGAFDVTFEDMRLQKGNKATDWTPAPEDVQAEIDEAKQEAQQAQTTADGKNSVFTQSTAPPTDGRKIGDVWFDTSRDNLMHRFDGQQWVEAKWGEQSIVADSITANHIKSLVGLNVNDQFVVDSQGNVKFAGHLEGATGSFITEGEYEGFYNRVDIDRIITVEGPSYKTELSSFGIKQTNIDDDFVFRHWDRGMTVSHPDGKPIAGMYVRSNGTLQIFASEGYSRLYIDVEETNIAGNLTANGMPFYEEGDWTPILDSLGTSANHAYGTQIGKYVRRGNEVTVYFDLEITTRSATATGTATIRGLPYSIKQSVPASGSISYFDNVNLPNNRPFITLGTTGHRLGFWAIGDNTPSYSLNIDTHFQSGSRVRGQITYVTEG